MVRSQAPSLTIAKFAQAGAVGVETIRYYQRKGLLQIPPAIGSTRLYGDEHLRCLQFIKLAQTAGFTLAEIQELLVLDSGSDRARARELASAKIVKLEHDMAELAKARGWLQLLVSECSADKPGPCPILATFEAGGNGKI